MPYHPPPMPGNTPASNPTRATAPAADGVTTAFVGAIAFLRLALVCSLHERYGYFRDELYYIACSDHLAWGYVDRSARRNPVTNVRP